MDTETTFLTGIAPEHIPAAIAALCLPALVWAGRLLLRRLAAAGSTRAAGLLDAWDGAPCATRALALLLLVTGTVHLALPFGHDDGRPALTLLFWACGAAFVGLAFETLRGVDRARLTGLLLLGSIVSYLVVAGSGWQEEPDQIGIATKLVELVALGLVFIPSLQPEKDLRARLRRPLASSAFVALTMITGLVIWVGSFAAHGHLEASAVEAHEHVPGTPPHEHADGHADAFAARAQAGVIMRPSSSQPPTLQQVEAAARLAQATRDGLERYQDLQVALADGYVRERPSLGLQAHYKNTAYEKDGAAMDPARPEKLVYASDGGRTLLLGAVFVMPEAGKPGPEVGGPLTRWHSHNVCVTLAPPAFGLVSPFGGCPLASLNVTVPEMIHVWTVDNPGGPYAERLDDGWVRRLLTSQGQ